MRFTPARWAAKALTAAASMLGGPSAGPWPRQGGTGFMNKVRFLLPGARRDWEAEAGDPWSNSVVALGLAWIGDRVARPKLRVMKRARNGDLREVADHGLVGLWTRPNEFYGRRAMEQAVVLSLVVDGNAYIWKRRDNAGRVCELWWIPHWRCQPTWPADGSAFIDGYTVSVDGRLVRVDKRDVIHVRKGIDPRNERYGISAMKAQLRQLVTDNAVSGYESAIITNGGVPAVVMVPKTPDDGPASEAEYERMKERWRDETSGDDAGGLVVPQGQYEVKPLGFSPEQLALDKLPQSSQARLAAATGVAAMSLGLNDPNKTYANLGEANRTSWGTIVANQELMADALRDDLVTEAIIVGGKITPPSGPLELTVEYDYSHIQELQESLDSLHARVRADWEKNLVRRARAQQALGYEPDPEEVDDGGPYYSETSTPPAAEPDAEEDEAAGLGADPAEGAKSWRY